jgi:large subunit ribosomal protein L29
MRADEIRELSADDIQARVAELEEERFRLRFRSATETLENPLRLRTIRKDIARLKTILTEQQRTDMTADKKADKTADKKSAVKADKKAARGKKTKEHSK